MFKSSAPGESPLPLPRNTHGAVSDIHYDVVKTRTMVSEVHRDVTNTHTMVSDLHRTMLKSQEGADNQYQPVSVVCALLHHQTNKRLPLLRLKPSQ